MKGKPPIPQASKPQVTVVCPFCHAHVTVHPTQAGFVIGCYRCNGQFQVPGPQDYQYPVSYQRAYLRPPGYQAFVDKKIAAGICGIFFGGLGIHKFILGFPGAGTIMLVFWLIGVFTGMCIVIPFIATVVMNIIGLIEGVTYLTKSDDDFYLTYAVQRREWF